jgi:hypothetical protein
MYNYNSYRYNNGDRFIGPGFVAPFLLGGITGGLIANNRPHYYPYPIYYRPYPYSYQYNQYYY